MELRKTLIVVLQEPFATGLRKNIMITSTARNMAFFLGVRSGFEVREPHHHQRRYHRNISWPPRP